MNYDIEALIKQIETIPTISSGPGWDRRAEVTCMKALRAVFSHPEMPLVHSFISYTLVALRMQAERDRANRIAAEGDDRK